MARVMYLPFSTMYPIGGKCLMLILNHLAFQENFSASSVFLQEGDTPTPALGVVALWELLKH